MVLVDSWVDIGEEFWKGMTPQKIHQYLNNGHMVNAQNKNGDTPIHFAAWCNETPQVIIELVNAGGNVHAEDTKGRTPLYRAVAYNDSLEVITTLAINLKVDVNIQTADGGYTPLYYAAKFNRIPQVFEILFNAGAEANVQDEYGNTPLHVVAKYTKYPEVVPVFLKNKADGKILNKEGQTAFDIAGKNKKIYYNLAYPLLQHAAGVLNSPTFT